MPKVWNQRDPNIPKDAVYVGRPTVWGNPFTHVQHLKKGIKVATREEAVHKYRETVVPIMLEDIKRELNGKDLVCWCAPLACHADVLLEVANEA